MSVFKTEAIALRRTDYSDSSQIITFYTRDFGKIHTIAKGLSAHPEGTVQKQLTF